MGSSNCDRTRSFLDLYADPCIYFLGSILNTCNAIVFYLILSSNKTKNENSKSLFVILYFKSLNDALLFIGNMFSIFYYCGSCESRNSLVMQIWYIVFQDYLTRVTEFFSICLEILISLDLLLSINTSLKNQLSILKYKYFNQIYMILFLVFSIGFYSFRFFVFKIESIVSNGTLSYRTEPNGLDKSSLIKSLEIIHAASRDLVEMIILIILNFLIILID